MRNGFHALPAAAEAKPDAAYVGRFGDEINDDLNVPRALAVAWEGLRGDLPAPAKRATLEQLQQAKREFEVGTKTIIDTNEAQARYDQIVAQ